MDLLVKGPWILFFIYFTITLHKWVFLSIYFTVMLRTWTYPWTIAKKMHYCYRYNEISMDPFGNNFLKLNSMWQDTWTLSVTNFWISLDVTGTQTFSWTLSLKNLWVSLNMWPYLGKAGLTKIALKRFSVKTHFQRIVNALRSIFNAFWNIANAF